MTGKTISKPKLLALRDSEGGRILSIKGYYEEKLSPINLKFSRYSFKRSRTVVCPFHSDNDPSFGCINSKNGGENYHCFGCKVYGDFFNFYSEMEKIYFGRKPTTEEVLLNEIVSRYGLEGQDIYSDGSGTEVAVSRETAMRGILEEFTYTDYERAFRKGRLMGRDTAYFNLQLLKFISEG